MRWSGPRFVHLAALACLLAAPASVRAQTFTWNNTGADWSTSTNWTAAGPPVGNGTTALFNVTGAYGTAPINNPTWAANPSFFAGMSLNPTAQFTGWNFTSTGSLTHFSLNATGPVTHTISGPSFTDQGAGNGLSARVEHGSTLEFTGSGSSTTRTFAISLHGSTLRIDNSGTNNANRLGFFAASFQTSAGLWSYGGTIDFIGNTALTSERMERLALAPGHTNVNIETLSTTDSTTLGFDELLRGGTGTNDRTGTVNFANTGAVGVLGATGNNPRILITTGFADGMLGPWATVGNSEFAFFHTVNGVRAAASGTSDYSQTYTTAIGTNLAQGQYGALDQDAGAANIVWSGSAGAGTGSFLRIRPGAAGQSLTFAVGGTGNVNLNAIVHTTPHDYTITRDTTNGNVTMRLTGSGAGLPRYLGVMDANATLTFNVPIGGAGTPVVKFGAGILDLTADMSGATFIGGTSAAITPMLIQGGVMRVSVGANGSLVNGSGQSIYFRGGVLEIAGGQNGDGASADFTRVLGSGANSVNWTTNTSARGSGGFSAFGSNASVNIGGNATPTSLTWRTSTNFAFDGDALLFGSSKSNATLRWLNPINLDNGTAGTYVLREVQVTRGTGTMADRTVLAGSIGGSTSTDFLKTGNGVLELTSANPYQGNTLVHDGTLIVSGTLGAMGGTRTGNVIVGKGAVLAGAGNVLPAAGKSVTVNPGGIIRGGNPAGASTASHTGTLTIESDLAILSTSADRGAIRFETHNTGGGTASASRIALVNTFDLNLNPGAGNAFAIELVQTASTTPLDLGQQYTITLATVGATDNIQLNGANLPDGTIASTNYVLLSSTYAFDAGHTLSVLTDATGKHLQLSFTPVPEPATVLGLAAGALVLGALGRRKRRSSIDNAPTTIDCHHGRDRS